MKKALLVVVVVAVSLVFAGSRDDISMLNMQVLQLEDRNDQLEESLNATQESHRLLETRISELNSDLQERDNTIEQKDGRIEQLENQLKLALESQAQAAHEAEVAAAVAAATPTVPTVSPYPISSSVIRKNMHNASSIAVLLSFYNGSALPLSGFEAQVTFSQGGQELLVTNIMVNQSMPAGENVTWYGAVPYNSTEASNVRFFNAEASTIDVNVIVTAVTKSNGIVQRF